MAGGVRFEMSAASPEDSAFAGGYSNGMRGNYPGASLDRSGSFREGGESRMLSSGASTPRDNAASRGNLPSLHQCLMLDPITMGDQQFTSLGELRRVLGIPFGGSLEDNPFGAANLKPHTPVATEDLKWFKDGVLVASNKARVRAKRLDDSIEKLNRYCEALNLKKQQRNEFITNERSGGSNLLKMGASRNSSDSMNQRPEDRTKTVVMNRRVRSSVTEIRAESRSSVLTRQPVVVGKDRDMLRGEGSDLVEEKIRRLPAGGEAWDKKMKRKRSVGTVYSRPLDGDAELKRTLHHKLNDEPCPQACDAQSFRSGSFTGGNGINKLDSNSLSANANGRIMLKNELDKVSLSKDLTSGLTKERLLPKANNKLNVRDDSQILNPNPVTKGKASRAPRNGPVTACNSSPSLPRTSGTPEGWEQPSSVTKNNSASGATNRKRPVPTGSTTPSMAQWVGQRPQKMSRTRRSNLLSPVSSHDEVQIPSESCSPSDVGGRLNSFGTNGLLQKSVANGAQQIRIKQEIVSSPARLSESEESGAGENHESRLKEKGPGSSEVDEKAVNDVQNTGSSILPTKKNKLLNGEETGAGVRRQGRSGRGSSVCRATTVATRENLETPASAKPFKSMRPGSEKNGSKSGRPPLKKLSDRKAFAFPGHISTIGSPDCAGEPDDDHEELLEAANFACSSNDLACSSSFWKKMEPIFGPVSLEVVSYFQEQLISVEENDECMSLMLGNANNVSGDIVHEENFVSKTLFSGQYEWNVQDQIQKGDISCGRLVSEGTKKVPPLYQRVLSALIMEDDIEEFENGIDRRTMSLQYNGDNFPGDTCASINVEPRNRIRVQHVNDTDMGLQTLNQCSSDNYPYSGASGFMNATGICNQLYNNDLSKVDFGELRSESGMLPLFSENGADGLEHMVTNSPGISSSDCPYEQMPLEDRLLLELQSVGLFQETVPDLADGGDEAIDKDIVGLQKLLHQQVDGKKIQLNKFVKAIEEGMDIERRRREQVAMDKLVESAYRKLLATRGSIASKYRIAKVSKQVAVAFMKRTLARCQKYEETGKSCFNEPALRDVIFAASLPSSNGETMKCNSLSSPLENQNSQQEPGISGSSKWAERPDHRNKFDRGSCGMSSLTHPSEQVTNTGPILYRGKKKEVLLDDVGSPSLKAASNLGPVLGRAKGKRSERERDKDTSARNSVTKADRQSLGNSKGERKTKTKPKQKTAQLSTSGNGLISNAPSAGFVEVVGNNNNSKREIEPACYNDIPQGPTETKKQMDFANLHLNDLDSIELGVANDLGGNQDLSTWFNFDEDGLQDHDAEGLDIPMDDLSDLNMLL
ncbi:uncharacterized protein [Pyrus communis]|uniref:uncharacterized protein isoform X1 n=2 Tax=Pyrus communis TaxID=23211 RepID=UPI0035BEF410